MTRDELLEEMADASRRYDALPINQRPIVTPAISTESSQTAEKIPAMKALDWLQDALDCTTGEHGEWWCERHERAMEDGMEHWWEWRDVRQNERPPLGVASSG